MVSKMIKKINYFAVIATVALATVFTPVKAVAGETYIEPVKYSDRVENIAVTEFISNDEIWLCDTPEVEYNIGDEVVMIVNTKATLTKTDDVIVKII